MGDGINDAPALRAADVGISVDNAVDIAKESADVILLEKNLMVLEEGVLEGRKVFVNILKYVRMGASSNFGNMFSVLGASWWLPFAHGAHPGSHQQPALRFFPSADSDRQRRPRADREAASMGHWRDRALHSLHRSDQLDLRLHDLFHDVVHVQVHISAAVAIRQPPDDLRPLFQTGWFVESLMTQTLIIHVIRTNMFPLSNAARVGR